MRIMNLADKKIIGKIPGMLLSRPDGEKQGFIDNLSAKNKSELQELLERQEKLLRNKVFISKLPDKGAKIKEFHGKILKEIQSKDVIDATCASLSKLEVSKKYVLEDIEWGKKHVDYEYVDSDDDEVDTLKILAQNVPCKKQVKKLLPEKPLITHEDLLEIQELKTKENEINFENEKSIANAQQSVIESQPHVKYLINKDENCHKSLKPKFLPHKSTVSDVHNPFKELTRSQKLKKFENTAATPPPSINGPVKCLSLRESLVLQKVQEEHRKQVELKHAHEKLMEQYTFKTSNDENMKISGNYREQSNEMDSDDENSEHELEVYDDEDDKAGTIKYTVTEYL